VCILGDDQRLATMSASQARVWPINILAAAKLPKPRELTIE
jgi:hypothetical protein